MRNSRFIIATLAIVALAFTAACGGGGQGLREPSNPLVIGSSSLPTTMSGEYVDFDIPLTGGCTGPYVVEIIAGSLPDGVGTVEGTVTKLQGFVLEDGIFTFTVKITDTSCTPFLTVTQEYVWDIQAGPLAIVGATPDIIPNAQYDDPQKYGDIDALETVVFSTNIAYNLIIAGGQGPYTCAIVDDPSDPDDGNLPLGTGMAPNSCSIVGAPVQVLSGGVPFRLTIRATDAVGQTVERKLQWKISTPPIILATSTLVDGKAGTSFSDSLTIIDGVPPFAFELTDNAPGDDGDPDTTDNVNDDISYPAGLTPVINSFVDAGLPFALTPVGPTDVARLEVGGARADYPADNDMGPNYGPFPSEGIFFRESGPGAGGFFGTPRRRGTFTVNVHVYSTLVPNELGQHAFRQYTHTIDPSEPPTGVNPAFTMDPSFTVEGVWPALPEVATIPEFEQGQAYNPDAGVNPAPGLQLLAGGGVPADGYTDAPHEVDRMIDVSEVPDSYKWGSDWDPDNLALPNPPLGIDVTVLGDVIVTDSNILERTARRYCTFTINDYQLPVQLENTQTNRFGYSVGPDVLIITDSSASLSADRNYYSASNRHAWNDAGIVIKKFLGFASGPQSKVLDATDLTATHSVPATAGLGANANPLGALLSGDTGGDTTHDLLRCSVNATGWWDDLHGLNPLGARPMAHAESNQAYSYRGEFGYRYSYHNNNQPSVSAVDVQDAEGVVHDPDTGVYADGGQLYHFESANRFGVFIIRTDGKVYVPFAYDKDGAIEGFGDGIVLSKATERHGALRMVHMTVSPDGRIAAMKLKQDQENMYEHALNSKILLFSLTGEKLFAGETFKIIDNGAASTGAGNRIQYAASMALTNSHLYFLIGTRSASSTSTSYTPLYYQSWSGHFLMSYDVIGGGASASMIPSYNADAAWTQGASTPMQTVYHHHGPHNYSSTYGGIVESYTYYGSWPYHRYFQEGGMNNNEHNVAPTPFRVSRDGSTVAFFAAEDMYSTFNANVYNSYAWVDYQGTGARRITSTRRHTFAGSARGYTNFYGPSEYRNWGRYNGPTPGIEISDDGTQVAFQYNAYAGTPSVTSGSYQYQGRSNILLCRSGTGNHFATLGLTEQEEVTALTFGGTHYWRFGSLAFTKDGTGLVFWGGAPLYISNTTSTSYQDSFNLFGTYYIHDVTENNRVVTMCSTTEGGSPASEGTAYTNLSPFNPGTSGQNNRLGAIFPYGGFMSRNRDFMYVANLGATSNTDATSLKLIGMNVSSVSGNTINGHLAGRAFIPANWPSRRGFFGNYYYYYNTEYPVRDGNAPFNHQNVGRHVMAKDTGWVFWGTGWQYQGPSLPYYFYSGSVYNIYYYGCYGYGGVGVYGFNADLGGAVAQLNEPSLSASNTSLREMLNFMEVTRDGSHLTYVSTADYYQFYKNRERINDVRNINFDTPDGSIHADFDRSTDAGRVEGSNGRAGEAMCTSTTSGAFYYAFKANAGNENAREIVKAQIDPATGDWEFTRFSSITGRMNVLYATR